MFASPPRSDLKTHFSKGGIRSSLFWYLSRQYLYVFHTGNGVMKSSLTVSEDKVLLWLEDSNCQTGPMDTVYRSANTANFYVLCRNFHHEEKKENYLLNACLNVQKQRRPFKRGQSRLNVIASSFRSVFSNPNFYPHMTLLFWWPLRSRSTSTYWFITFVLSSLL